MNKIIYIDTGVVGCEGKYKASIVLPIRVNHAKIRLLILFRRQIFLKQNITWHMVLLQVQTRSVVVSTRVKKGSTLNLLKVTSVFHLSA